MLQKIGRKVLDQFVLFAKLDQIANLVMFTEKVRRHLNMIDQFMGVANLKSCKRGRKVLGSICNIFWYSILAKIGSFWQSLAQIGVKVFEISQSKESTG